MNDLHSCELERYRMNAPIEYDELSKMFSQNQILRFQAIHDSYLKSGKVNPFILMKLNLSLVRSTNSDYKLNSSKTT